MEIEKTSTEEVYSFLNPQWHHFFDEKGLPFDISRYAIAAYQSQDLVGAAVIKIKGGLCRLEDIFVRENQRRKGIGSQLLSFIEQEAIKSSCRRIVAETSELHEEALSFYHKHNFNVIAKIPDYYYGATWFILAKDL